MASYMGGWGAMQNLLFSAESEYRIWALLTPCFLSFSSIREPRSKTRTRGQDRTCFRFGCGLALDLRRLDKLREGWTT